MPSNAGAIRAGRAFVELFADDKALVRGLRGAQARLRNFGRSVTATGTQLLGLGAAGAVALAGPIKLFADFADKMSLVRAVTGAMEDQFVKLTEQAKELGRTTSFTASQVAGAMIELGRAGFLPDEIDQAIGAFLNLSRATGTELPLAAEIGAAAMRGFNLAADQSTRIADVLSSTANKSAQTLEDLGESMKLVAPIAVEADASIEDVAAALAVLANNGIKGSLAGNAIARAYKNLSTSAAQDKLAALGVQAVDAAGDLRPLASILEELGQATAGFGSAQKLNLFETLFGRGQAAALKLASPLANLRDMQKELANTGGSAARVAKQMDDNLGGAFRRLLSGAEGVAIAIGESLAPSISFVADTLANASQFVTAFVKNNRGLIIGVLGGSVALVTLGGVLIFVGLAATGLASILGLLATTVAAIGVVFGLLLSPVGLFVAALVAGSAAAVHFSDRTGAAVQFVMDRFGELRAFVGQVVAGVAAALRKGDVQLAAEVLWAGVLVAFQTGKESLLKIWIGVKFALVRVWQDAGFVLLETWQNTMAGIKTALVATAEFIIDKWLSTVKTLAQAIANVMAFFSGEEITVSEDDIAIARIVRPMQDAIRELRKTIEQENAAALATIEQAWGEAGKQIDQQREAALGKLTGAADAKRRLAELIEQAKQAAEETKKANEEASKAVDQKRGALGDLAAASAEGGSLSAAGTFSSTRANAALGLGSTTTEKLTEIVDQLKNLNRKADDGLAFGGD